MQHVELLCRVAARVEQDCLLPSRMVGQEARRVEHLSVNDHPAVVLLVVLCDLLDGVRAG